MESMQWWAGDEGCWCVGPTVETISAHSQLSTDDTSSGSGISLTASSVDSSESSDLEASGRSEMADCGPGRRDDRLVEKLCVHDVDQRRSWSDTSGSGGGEPGERRRSNGEWVVRRRSDGWRYIGHRRRRDPTERRRPPAETERRRTDPARRSWPPLISHHSPGNDDQRRGGPDRRHEDVIHGAAELDLWRGAGYDDYGTVEWICSPHGTDSRYRVVAVV